LPLSHEHDHDGHRHDLRSLTRRRLWIALAVNAVFLVVEIAGGILTNSLALLADAGHMLTDVAALVLAIVVAHLAERPPSPRHTFGLLRAEVLGAFANGAFLVLIVGFVFTEAWRRFGTAQEVDAIPMIVVAMFGLGANMVSAWVLFGSRNENVNLEGAYLHMFGDALGSVGAVTAGIVILLTGRTFIDPLVSIGIGLVILWSSLGLIRKTITILLEATPEGIDYDEIRTALLAVDHVTDVRDLHIWTISSGIPALSAHLNLEAACSDTTHWQVCLRDTQNLLRKRFGIVHTTLQFEPPDYERDDRPV
jgi:cobalt-zinc-cadmium efflux system protein